MTRSMCFQSQLATKISVMTPTAICSLIVIEVVYAAFLLLLTAKLTLQVYK